MFCKSLVFISVYLHDSFSCEESYLIGLCNKIKILCTQELENGVDSWASQSCDVRLHFRSFVLYEFVLMNIVVIVCECVEKCNTNYLWIRIHYSKKSLLVTFLWVFVNESKVVLKNLSLISR